MSEIPRRTVRDRVAFAGTGLFTGAPAVCAVRPARAGEGLTLRRTDVPGSARGTMDAAHVCADATALGLPANIRNTTLAPSPGAPVATVEHLLSALAGLGITDAHVEIDGPEVPAGDGSCAFIVEALLDAGIADLEGAVEPIVIRETIRVAGADGVLVEATPGEAELAYELEYPDHAEILPAQRASWRGDPGAYARDVAPARTFCLEEEAMAMRRMGLFEHLTARDMLVLGPRGPIDNELRFADEPARHKLLDLIGDLALAGAPIAGRVVARRAGHALNHEMARRLAALRG